MGKGQYTRNKNYKHETDGTKKKTFLVNLEFDHSFSSVILSNLGCLVVIILILLLAVGLFVYSITD